MREDFVLRELPEGKIQAYSWHVENPDRVLCIVHGIGGYGYGFDRIVAAMNEKKIAGISLDLRGHGKSFGKRGHCAPRSNVLEDITCMIKYAKEKYVDKDVVLYGHSMGGNIVLDYRSRGELNNELSGYIVSSPWIRLYRNVPKIVYYCAKLISKISPTMTFSASINENDLGRKELVDEYRRNELVHNRISALCAVEGFDIGTMLEKGSNPKTEIDKTIPLLLMHGTEDKICSVEGSRALAKITEAAGENIMYVEWSGYCHELFNGNEKKDGAEVIDLMAEWVSRGIQE